MFRADPADIAFFRTVMRARFVALEHGLRDALREVTIFVPADRGDRESACGGIEGHGFESRFLLQQRGQTRDGAGRGRVRLGRAAR